jgi:hypothetical protein
MTTDTETALRLEKEGLREKEDRMQTEVEKELADFNSLKDKLKKRK